MTAMFAFTCIHRVFFYRNEREVFTQSALIDCFAQLYPFYRFYPLYPTNF